MKFKPRKFTYTAHRYLALVIALQLLAWSVGGMVFAFLDIEDVRGNTDARKITNHPLDIQSIQSFPQSIQAAINDLNTNDIATITLTDRGLGPHWEIKDTESNLLARLDQLGKPTPLITQEDAEFIALRDFKYDSTIAKTTLLDETTESIPSEYKGGLLPAYQIKLNHPKNPNIYIDAKTAQILARRNNTWRTFDFFWMLHIMDYKDRSNFNHPLLLIASILAVLTSITGIALWLWRLAPKKKRKHHLPTPPPSSPSTQ